MGQGQRQVTALPVDNNTFVPGGTSNLLRPVLPYNYKRPCALGRALSTYILQTAEQGPEK